MAVSRGQDNKNEYVVKNIYVPLVTIRFSISYISS